mgnify:CR=1 FL=1
MIQQINFETIQEIWYEEDMWGQLAYAPPTNDYLFWNGKEYLGQKEKRIKDLKYSKPIFYGYIEDKKILGVNSYFHVNDEQCRSRGLYVYPEYRKYGIGTILLKYAIEQNRNKKYKFIWSKPRNTAIGTYKKAGFMITSEPFEVTPDGEPMLYKNYYCKYDY